MADVDDVGGVDGVDFGDVDVVDDLVVSDDVGDVYDDVW